MSCQAFAMGSFYDVDRPRISALVRCGPVARRIQRQEPRCYRRVRPEQVPLLRFVTSVDVTDAVSHLAFDVHWVMPCHRFVQSLSIDGGSRVGALSPRGVARPDISTLLASLVG